MSADMQRTMLFSRGHLSRYVEGAQHLKPACEVILVGQHGRHHIIALQRAALLDCFQGPVNDGREVLVLHRPVGGVAGHQLGVGGRAPSWGRAICKGQDCIGGYPGACTLAQTYLVFLSGYVIPH